MVASHTLVSRLALLIAVTLTGADTQDVLPAAEASSVEVRWFFKGDIPHPILTWFEPAGRLGNALRQTDHDKREDLYLLADDESIALKLRAGELELKLLKKGTDVRLAAGKATGRAEFWLKWGWAPAPGAEHRVLSAFTAPQKRGVRHSVLKDRRQRKLRLHENRRLEPVSITERLALGCLAEITSLRVSGQKWWSLAIEVFGAEDLSKLEACADWILSDYPAALPTRASSFSYPAWLLSLGRLPGG
jgi:hypothetical protein